MKTKIQGLVEHFIYNCARARTDCHMIDFFVSKFSDSYAAAQPFVKLNIFFVNLLVFT
jgi:hypothetical protein